MYSQHYNLDVSMGDVIRTILRRKGITQSDFAHKMGFKKVKNACTFYSLKDTIAERLLKNGFEIKFIQQLFRHHDISITNAYLSNFNPIVNKELLANFPKM